MAKAPQSPIVAVVVKVEELPQLIQDKVQLLQDELQGKGKMAVSN